MLKAASDAEFMLRLTNLRNRGLFNSSFLNLGNVNNTSDLDKPISSAQQAALNLKQDTLISGVNIQTLNGGSILGTGNITIDKNTLGLSNVDNTSDADKPVSIAQQAALDLKVPQTRTINGYPLSANVVLTKTDVGLSNVDNTADIDKPVSTAQQAALNLKVPQTRTINGYPLSANVVLKYYDVAGGAQYSLPNSVFTTSSIIGNWEFTRGSASILQAGEIFNVAVGDAYAVNLMVKFHSTVNNVNISGAVFAVDTTTLTPISFSPFYAFNSANEALVSANASTLTILYQRTVSFVATAPFRLYLQLTGANIQTSSNYILMDKLN